MLGGWGQLAWFLAGLMLPAVCLGDGALADWAGFDIGSNA